METTRKVHTGPYTAEQMDEILGKAENLKNLSQLVNDSGYAKNTDDITGNSATSTKLKTKRTVTFSGDMKGSFQFDGSGNVACELTYAGGDGTLLGTRCFGIEINRADAAKTVKIIGNTLLYNLFKKWVDESPAPCEISKDKTKFHYLVKTGYALRTDGTASAWSTSDASYLQMVELENINIGWHEDGTKLQVWFNMDAECPAGFRRWFKGDTKLMARYDSIPNGDGTTMNVTRGQTYGSNSLSAILMRNKTAATMPGLLEETAWELVVMSWIFSAYYKTVNHQSVFQGVDAGGEAVARAYIQGSTDTLTTPHGQVTVTVAGVSVKPYRFMFMENAIHGLQWIWGAGCKTNGGSLWMCYDEVRANEQSVLENLTGLTGFERACSYPTDLSSTYPKQVNFFTVCKDKGGSSTTGFCDGQWSNANNGNVFYRGGNSYAGAICGGFALSLSASPSGAAWIRRGRCALSR